MSLILDALKKAAEQKMAKEGAAETQTVSTFNNTIALDNTEIEIDNTVAFDVDRTEHKEDETTAPHIPDNSVSRAITEVADATEFTQFEVDETKNLDDDIVIELLDDYEATEIIEQQQNVSQDRPDSDKAVCDSEEDETQLDLTPSLVSEKDVDNIGDIDATYLTQNNKRSHEVLTDDDVTAFIGERDIPTNARAISQSPEGHRQSDDSVGLENMSLTLMDMDDPTLPQTKGSNSTASPIIDSLTNETKVTDSLITEKLFTNVYVQILAQNRNTTEGIDRVDIQKYSNSNNDKVIVTKRPIAFGGLSNQETVERQHSTLTRSNTPDNYDRTLYKVDQDAASKIFADMKSESPVLMTPDYAKKLFISHSSKLRLNHYKIYAGVTAVVLLSILIHGLFEYEEESINIDNSLRSLKRDPIPNLRKRLDVQEQASLITQTDNLGVDTKTLSIVKNAADSNDLATQKTKVIANDPEVSTTIKSGYATVAKENLITRAATPVKKQSETLVFQFTNKSTFTEKDKLIKDAYAAYQRGNNNTALEKYNRVLTEEPLNRNALLARAAINVQNANRADAIEDYQTLLIANPKDSLAMSSLISVASISPSKSESKLKGMIRDEPSSPYLNFALANVYGAQNRWQEAQNLYFKALENNPTDPNYAYNLAVSLEHISKFKVAITYYQRALANFNNGLATFDKSVVHQRIEVLEQ
jgi:tetratricopeptide (TPR) repeat protein